MDGVNLYLWFERSKMPAWGVLGGKEAKGPEVTVYDEHGNVVTHMLKCNNYRLGKNWVVEMKTGGGGGYGNPFERKPEKVAYDVKNRFISRERAKIAYGVEVNEDGTVNVKATEK